MHTMMILILPFPFPCPQEQHVRPAVTALIALLTGAARKGLKLLLKVGTRRKESGRAAGGELCY